MKASGAAGTAIPAVGDRAFWFDALVIVVVSVAIACFSQRLLLMSVFVPAVVLARFVCWARLSTEERGGALAPEIVFFLICTLLGGFNDWNSVVNHKIYDYTVPHYFDFSTIPLWMLLFWGMILRFIARLARWERLGPDGAPSDRVGIGGLRANRPGLKIAGELALVMATRWMVYRFYANPVLSWPPFLAALLLFSVLFGASRHDVKLLLLFLLFGPVVEILYIQIGGLHSYLLGWFGGVPLWIVLWWALSILIWKDLAFRIEKRLSEVLGTKD